MASITEIADKSFVACETGKGWEACQAYCTPEATFAAQAEPLADVKTLQEYCDWMKGMFEPMPNGRYELVSFGCARGGPLYLGGVYGGRSRRGCG
jgi:hypothetical protein